LLGVGLGLPHLLGSWPRVLVFGGIAAAAAWGCGKLA